MEQNKKPVVKKKGEENGGAAAAPGAPAAQVRAAPHLPAPRAVLPYRNLYWVVPGGPVVTNLIGYFSILTDARSPTRGAFFAGRAFLRGAGATTSSSSSSSDSSRTPWEQNLQNHFLGYLRTRGVAPPVNSLPDLLHWHKVNNTVYHCACHRTDLPATGLVTLGPCLGGA